MQWEKYKNICLSEKTPDYTGCKYETAKMPAQETHKRERRLTLEQRFGKKFCSSCQPTTVGYG
jgi:hypothetical protein